MGDKPTEIWCKSGLYYDFKDDWSEGSWSADNWGGEKYVRADLFEELEEKLAVAVEIAGLFLGGKNDD